MSDQPGIPSKVWSDLLIKNGAFPKSAALSFVPMRRNLDRRDAQERIPYLIHGDKGIVGHLLVGKNLKKLADLTKLFAKAFPQFAPATLLYIDAGNHQLFVREYVQGLPLRDALLAQGANPQAGLSSFRKLRDAFLSVIRPSKPEAAVAEIHGLASQLDELSGLREADRILLREIVLQPIARELADAKTDIRLSHGDFISQNIIITSSGEPKLIDCEFVSETHFHELDWRRFLLFSDLHPRHLEQIKAELPAVPDWHLALFWVQQIIKEHEINRPDVFNANLAVRMRSILELVQLEPRRFGRSVLLETRWTAPAATPKAPEPHLTTPFAQVFWSAKQGAFSETDSQRLPLLPNSRSQNLTFTIKPTGIAPGQPIYLRFDPLVQPALCTIEKISVVDPATKEEVWRVDAQTQVGSLKCGGTAIAVPGKPPLCLFSFDSDPSVVLPAITRAQKTESLQVVVVFQVETSLILISRVVQSLLERLPKNTPSLDSWPSLLSVMLVPPYEPLEKRLAQIQQELALVGRQGKESENQLKAERDSRTSLEQSKSQLEKSLHDLSEAKKTLLAENDAITSALLETSILSHQSGGLAVQLPPNRTLNLGERLQVIAGLRALIQRLIEETRREQQQTVKIHQEREKLRELTAELQLKVHSYQESLADGQASRQKLEIQLSELRASESALTKEIGALTEILQDTFALGHELAGAPVAPGKAASLPDRIRMFEGIRTQLHLCAEERNRAVVRGNQTTAELAKSQLLVAALEAKYETALQTLTASDTARQKLERQLSEDRKLELAFTTEIANWPGTLAVAADSSKPPKADGAEDGGTPAKESLFESVRTLLHRLADERNHEHQLATRLQSDLNKTQQLLGDLEAKHSANLSALSSSDAARQKLELQLTEIRATTAALEKEKAALSVSLAEVATLGKKLTQQDGDQPDAAKGFEWTLYLQEIRAALQQMDIIRSREYHARLEATEEATTLRTRTGNLESDMSALRTRCAHLEQARRDLEDKLATVSISADHAEINEARLLAEMGFIASAVGIVVSEARQATTTHPANGEPATLDATMVLRQVEELRTRLELVVAGRTQAEASHSDALKRIAELQAHGTTLEARLLTTQNEFADLGTRYKAALADPGYRFHQWLVAFRGKLFRRPK